MKKKYYLIFSVLLCVTAIPANLFPDTSWNLLRDDEGIRIYTRPVQGSNIDEFKGVTLVSANVDRVQSVLSDIPSHVRWRFNCVESRVLRRKDDSNMLIYTITKTPWPLAYRDVVLRVTRSFVPAKHMVIICMNAVQENIVPLNRRYVRIKSLEGKWILEKKSAEETLITYTTRLNPAGAIPESLANRASRDMPFNTLRGLHRMIKRIRSGQDPRL